MKVRRIAARVVAVGALAGGIALGSAGVASADGGGGGHFPRHDDDHQNCAWHEGHSRWFDDDHQNCERQEGHNRWFDDDFHRGDWHHSFDSDHDFGHDFDHHGHGW